MDARPRARSPVPAQGGSISWAWLIVQSRALAVTLARWASAAWAWTSVHAVHAGARQLQGRLDRIGVARSHIARARRRALAWARQNFATDQGAGADSRAQCARRRPHRLGMDRSDVAHARHHAAAMVRRGLEMDSRRGADHHARIAQGNAAGIVMDRRQLAHGRGRVAAQCFRRRRLVGSKCQSREPRLSGRSLGELFLGRPQHQQHLAWLPACRAAAPKPIIAPWRSGAARRWSASSRSACSCP